MMAKDDTKPTETKKGKRGPKDWCPDDKTLKAVENMAAELLNQQQIAAVLEISVDTLAKYALDHFNRGRAKSLNKLTKKALQMAAAGNVPMLIFCLKTQAAWSERQIVETVSPDGQAAPVIRFEISPPGTRKPVTG